jgi:uncharacterized protein YerC
MVRMVVRVRSEVKRQLRKLKHKTADKGLAARCQIILLWSEGTGWFEISKAIGCSLSWVGRVIRRFRDHGIAGLLDRREDNGLFTKSSTGSLWITTIHARPGRRNCWRK